MYINIYGSNLIVNGSFHRLSCSPLSGKLTQIIVYSSWHN
uniref:Uncharacterized protein n=1 Tax=Anguilla anguilla TaxID=7936 RepID=A0A0E9QYA3_ANGAN